MELQICPKQTRGGQGERNESRDIGSVCVCEIEIEIERMVESKKKNKERRVSRDVD